MSDFARFAQPRLSDEALAKCDCGVMEHGLAYHAYSCSAMQEVGLLCVECGQMTYPANYECACSRG